MIKTIVSVFAHPDDEVPFSGLLYRAINCGIKVHLICATRGGAGKIRNRDLINDIDIKCIRAMEIEESCRILGVSSLSFLELEDGNSHRWNSKNVKERLVGILNKINPDIVITFDSNGGNGHPDHKEISRYTSLAFERMNSDNSKLLHLTLFPESFIKGNLELLSIPKSYKDMFVSKYTVKDSEVSYIIKLDSREINKKINLLECYKSQFPDEQGNYYKLPLNVFRQLATYECYYLENSTSAKNRNYKIMEYGGVFNI